MKQSIYFKISMSRCMMLQLLFFVSFAAMAQEAYSVFTEADSTLTFFYDDQRSTRTGTSYSLGYVWSTYSADSVPEWDGVKKQVTKVVFDTTFVGARPTTTRYWFAGMSSLISISGIHHFITD